MKAGFIEIDQDHWKSLHQQSVSTGLPVTYLMALDEYKEIIDDAQKRRLIELGKQVLAKVDVMNSNEKLRADERVDIESFRDYLLQGLVRMCAISENMDNQLLDRYLTQRGHLPMLEGVLKSAAFLDYEDVMILREFFQNGGKRFINIPKLTVDLLGYIEVYKALNLRRKQFGVDLLQPAEDMSILTNRLGSRVIKKIAEGSGIKIDVGSEAIDGLNLAEKWNFRFLGRLMSTQKAWTYEEKQFFRVLLKASLEGKQEALLYPPAYQLTPANVLGEENAAVVQRVRRHNLGVLREMEQEGLNVNAWLHPNDVVKPVELYEPGSQRAPMEILRDFKKKLDTLKGCLEKTKNFSRWQQIAKGIGAWARIDESDSDPRRMMKNRPPLFNLQRQLHEMQAGFEVGRIPEAVADMQRVLAEAIAFDPNKPVVKEFLSIRFWRRDIGRDMFIGDCADSCTSVGKNASAIFQFILDQGTMYAVIENQRHEEEGYARFLLGEGPNKNTPLINIDTVDGTIGLAHFDQVKLHIDRLAEAIGLSADQVHYKKFNSKLGGVLLNGYFHHTYIANGRDFVHVEVSQPQSDIDNWKPKNGWDSAQLTKNDLRSNAVFAERKGGIDLTPANNALQIYNSDGEINFHMDPAQLAQFQNTTGFTVSSITIQPLKSLTEFLTGNQISQHVI